mmetsp:Transcript_42959/g.51577  ORF Transcript_42959/g.51577 Transcript_42959/m.51577 type:complete len:102 (-) Transcript_42959:527-832(-)
MTIETNIIDPNNNPIQVSTIPTNTIHHSLNGDTTTCEVFCGKIPGIQPESCYHLSTSTPEHDPQSTNSHRMQGPSLLTVQAAANMDCVAFYDNYELLTIQP